MPHDAKNVHHGVKNVRHGAENVGYGAENVLYGAKIVRQGAKNVWHGAKKCVTLSQNSCRILCSVLLSAAVIGVRPVLIIEVGTHWRQVKGIKSYLTLSGGSRTHGQTVHLWMSLC